MQELYQLKNIINEIKVLLDAMRERRLDENGIRNLNVSVREINTFLYFSEILKFQKVYNMGNEEEYNECIKELELLINIWEKTISRRDDNEVNREFWGIYEFFKYVDKDCIYQMVVEHFKSLPEGLRIEFLSLPFRYTWMQNKLDFTQNDFSLIAEYVKLMVDNIENYRWLYEHLEDNRSKKILNGIVRYWFEFNVNKLHSFSETVFEDYYDLDILECGKEDVLVDLGAYTGDSVCDYIKVYGAYKRIYAYEITPSTYQSLVRNVSQYPNVITMRKGVGSSKGEMFVEGESNGAGNRLQNTGDVEVEVVTLDEDIKEPITVIKMDIEGAEKDAILGASEHIRTEKPKLLVSTYHLPNDIFEIPYLINSIRADYKFYMRFNGRGLWPCDYVLFAV